MNIIITNHNHPFHLVTYSPWPIIISFRIFNNLIYIIRWFHNINNLILISSLPSTLLCMYFIYDNMMSWENQLQIEIMIHKNCDEF